MEHFLNHLKKQVLSRSDEAVLTDYQGQVAYSYRTMVAQMEHVDHILQQLGVGAGDHVAICGRNSSNWGVAFMCLMATRRVAVSILPDFTPEGICSLVEHSQAKALLVGDAVWNHIKEQAPKIPIVGLWNLQVVGGEKAEEALTIPTLTDEKLKEAVGRWDYTLNNSLAMINYTSGTTSSPKGVMLTHENISSNVEQVFYLVDIEPGEKLVSILPLAHMYGLCIELVGCASLGVHIHFIQRNPTPTILAQALNDIHPCALVCVPLVLEKVFKKSVLPKVQKPLMRVLMALPGIKNVIADKIRHTIIDAMGGEVRYFVVGGAAFNQEVEDWMVRLGMPYILGYGMTECGPLIAVSRVGDFAKNSCGKAAKGMEVRIDSENPQEVAGEIQTRGANVMMGYFRNEEATRNTFTKDGWLKTGDLGIIDKDGNVFIKGRSKSMILGPSGQNIYPEEIEDQLNSLPGIAESLVVERNGKLVALVYCDPMFTRRLRSIERHREVLKLRLRHINRSLPAYSQIAKMEFVDEEFEKTPKKSIKRFLYQ